MDKELKALLDEARSMGASLQQLDDIVVRYNTKKKSQNQDDTTSLSETTPLVSKETKTDGGLESQKQFRLPTDAELSNLDTKQLKELRDQQPANKENIDKVIDYWDKDAKKLDETARQLIGSIDVFQKETTPKKELSKTLSGEKTFSKDKLATEKAKDIITAESGKKETPKVETKDPVKELQTRSNKVIQSLIESDDFINNVIIPDIAKEKAQEIDDFAKNLIKDIDLKHIDNETLSGLNTKIEDYAKKIKSESINSDPRIKRRIEEIQQPFGKYIDEKTREVRRENTLSEFAKLGTVTEALENTFVNSFPQQGKIIGLDFNKTLNNSVKREIDYINNKLNSNEISLDDKVNVTNSGFSTFNVSGATNFGNPEQEKVHGQVSVREQLAMLNDTKEKNTRALIRAIQDIKDFDDKMSIYEQAHVLDDGITWKNLGTMIGSQLPQMAIAMASYGIGNMMSEYAGAYKDNLFAIARKKYNTKNPTNEQLLAIIDNNEDKQAASVAYGVVAGALERIGAGKSFDALLGSESTMGSLLKGEFKQFLKNTGKSVAKAGKAGFTEGFTEGLQSIAQQGSKVIATGDFNYDNTDVFESAIQGAVVGFLTAGLGGIKNQTVREFTRNIPKVAVNLNDSEINVVFDKANKTLDDKLDAKEITLTEYQENKDYLKKAKESATKIPKTFTTEQKQQAVDLLIEKEVLKETIDGKDENLVQREKERISDINKKLREISIKQFIDEKLSSKEAKQKEVTKVLPKKTKVSEETQLFAEELGTPKDSEFAEGATEVKVGNSNVILKENADTGNIIVETISTEKDQRGKGSFSNAFDKVVNLADEKGVTLEATVLPFEKETDLQQWINVIEKRGFVKEDGTKIEKGDKLIREPQTDTSFENIDNIINEAKKKTDIANDAEVSSTTKPRTSEQKVETVQPTDKTKRSAKEVRLSDKPNVFATNKNEYEVNVVDGELEITPLVGNEKPSISERKKVTEQYVAKTNFDSGKRANLDGIRQNEVFQKVADESQNAKEVAETLQSAEFETVDKTGTKEHALATVLKDGGVKKSSLRETVGNQVEGVPNSYYRKVNGKQYSLDQLRELAQEHTEHEVTIQDVADFIVENNSPKEVLKPTENQTKTDLQDKFTQLTGLKATDKNINAVANKANSTQLETKQKNTEKNTDEEVPFQTDTKERTVAQIVGKQLTGLLNRLMQTGLAKNIRIMSDQGIDKFLSDLGVSKNAIKYAINKRKKIRYYHSNTTGIFGKFRLRNRRGFYGVYFSPIKRYSKKFGDFTYKVGLRPKNTLIIKEKKDFSKYGNIFNIEKDGYNKIISEGYDSIAWYRNGKLMEFIVLDIDIIEEKELQLQKELSDKGITITPNGFVYKDVVYINRDKVKSDTPIHEFGHLWNAFVKENHREVYDKGIQLIEGTEYHKDVENNPAYNHLDKEAKLEEALAQAIGEKGANILNESKKSKFAKWLKTLFNKIASGLGIRNLTGTQLSKLTLEKYTDLVGAELLSGEKIGKYETPDKTDISNIDVAIAEQKARDETKEAILKDVQYDNIFEKDIKDRLKQYLSDVLDSTKNKDITDKQIETLINTIDKAKTYKNYQSAVIKIDNLIERSKNRAERKIEAFKKRQSDLRDRINDKKKSISERKKAFISFVNNNINKRGLAFLEKHELKILLDSAELIKTPKSLIKHLTKADEILTDVQNRYVFENINNVLNRGLKSIKTGFIKANLTAEEQKDILESIKNLIKIPKTIADKVPFKTPLKERKNETLNTHISNIQRELDEITLDIQYDDEGNVSSANPKTTYTDEEINKITAYNIALDILNSINTSDVYNANQLLQKSFTSIKSIYDFGKNSIKSQREQIKKEFNDFKEEVYDETDPLKRSELPENKLLTEKKLIEKANKGRGVVYSLYKPIKQIINNMFHNRTIKDLQAIGERLSKKGIDANFSTLIRFLREVNLAKNDKLTAIREAKNEILDAKRKIFGDIIKKRPKIIDGKFVGGIVTDAKSLFEFRKRMYIELEDAIENDDGTTTIVKTPVVLSQDEALQMFLYSKRADAISGLVSAGFTENVIKDIENKLSDKMKKYGEFLIDFYKKRQPILSEVYKKLNLHSLGNIENYTGRIRRRGVNYNDIDLHNPTNFGSTTFNSLKTTVKNNKPIEIVGTDMNLAEYIEGYSHYIANAEIERKFSKLLNDAKFRKGVLLNNDVQGETLLDLLKYHNENFVKKNINQERDLKLLNFTHKRVVETILGGKIRSIFTQSASALTGLLSVPDLTTRQKVEVAKNLFKDTRHLIKNSNFIKNRRDKEVLSKALANTEASFKASDITVQSDTDLGAYTTLLIKSLHSAIQKTGFAGISIGDIIGVLGTTPVYRAYILKLTEQHPNWSNDKIEKEAMRIFEQTANNAQQSQTEGGKSQLQNSRFAGKFLSFTTNPFANYKNAVRERLNLSRRLRREMAKHKTTKSLLKFLGVDTELASVTDSKGDVLKTALRYVNYSVVQQALYTALMSGSVAITKAGFDLMTDLLLAYDDDDEREEIKKAYTEEEKTVTASMGGVYQELPIAGWGMKLVIDKYVLEKKHTYANLAPFLVKDEIDKLDDYWKYYQSSKDPQKRKKWIDLYIKKATGLVTGVPQIYLDFLGNTERIANSTDLTFDEKGKIFMGWGEHNIRKYKENVEKLDR